MRSGFALNSKIVIKCSKERLIGHFILRKHERVLIMHVHIVRRRPSYMFDFYYYYVYSSQNVVNFWRIQWCQVLILRQLPLINFLGLFRWRHTSRVIILSLHYSPLIAYFAIMYPLYYVMFYNINRSLLWVSTMHLICWVVDVSYLLSNTSYCELGTNG